MKKKYKIAVIIIFLIFANIIFFNRVNNKDKIKTKVAFKYKIICCGDSLTRGAYGMLASGKPDNRYQNYPYYLARYLKVSYSDGNENIDSKVINLGVDGATPKSWYSYFEDKKNLFKTSNNIIPVVVMMFGTNGDFTDTLETDTNASSFTQYNQTSVGLYCREIEEINQITRGKARIVLCMAPYINPRVHPDYAKNIATANLIIPKIASKYNLPIINTYSELGISSINSNLYQPADGIHYNQDGYKLLGGFIYCKLKDIVPL